MKLKLKGAQNFLRDLAGALAGLIELFQRPIPAIAGFLTVLVLFVLLFRWSDRAFREAEYLESHQRYSAAIRQFERFALKHPRDPRAPEALVRAGMLYANVFARCEEAKPLFERAAREFESAEPWSSKAREGLLNCPDYFPLRPGTKWTYVDSESGGRNMRLEIELQTGLSTGVSGAEMDGAYFAGRRRFRGYHRRYAKEDWAIWEMEGKDRVCLLKYPFEPGMRWLAKREGKRVELSIESIHETVVVKAGRFQDCLKLRETQPGQKAWKYDYFAPGVGRVKTTIGGPGFEKPNTELKKVVFPPTAA